MRWPPPEVRNTDFFPQPNHTLTTSAPENDVHQLKYVPSIGVEAGFWWGELLSDQRPVDAFSLVYDSAPLEKDMAILGRPNALLQASATAPLANWFARLSDIAPDGTVTQITGAGINGAQRDGMTDPHDLEPGKTYAINIEMHLTSWVFPKGHRVRFSVVECIVADDFADAVFDDDFARTWQGGFTAGASDCAGAWDYGRSVPASTAVRRTIGHERCWISVARNLDIDA